MPNIMNKEEAERVKEIAKMHWKNKNHDRAVRLFEKSLKLYPLPGVEQMRDRCLREKGAGQQRSQSAAATAAARATNSKPADPGGRTFTPQQAEMVRKIKQCGKNPYKILGLERDATDADVKKAYRKLALKFHPDKNAAPGAEDAFKAVSNAFATLSDADKRAYYDRWGDAKPESPGHGGGGSGMHFRGGGMHGDIDPDEIFRAFFGGGFPGSGVHVHHFGGGRGRQRQPQGGGGGGGGGGLGSIIQLMPLIILFMLSFLDIGGSSGGSGGGSRNPFRLTREGAYTIPRVTQTQHVRQGINYFVKSDFARGYGANYHYLSRVETMVEQTYFQNLPRLCEKERRRQKQLVLNAKRAKKGKRDELMKKALGFELKHCKELKDIQSGW
eukprot:g1568.t1